MNDLIISIIIDSEQHDIHYKKFLVTPGLSIFAICVALLPALNWLIIHFLFFSVNFSIYITEKRKFAEY